MAKIYELRIERNRVSDCAPSYIPFWGHFQKKCFRLWIVAAYPGKAKNCFKCSGEMQISIVYHIITVFTSVKEARSIPN